ncbi:sulfatase-like hydrolase/transferase [Arenibacter sp. ARW7G5Y1]|uniref:sulfatase-like hydrolase/transferase n=1 Tax=Arenibacter sp. ARW7G5Y1 TaxID=2135619 RepID=UPI000D764DCB|nr:sulfatase-like hydrolase/transferase [Arenibacter sp. ARW7G5Y1]PXX28341.1 arylsulfatase A-like enzyme [Arenibacter sp. ARW7G5Y1]
MGVFKNAITIGLGILFISLPLNAYAQTTTKGRPNVIVIMTDDQGSIDLNSYGATDLYTPNMDRLAKEGVRFTQFYAGAPVCSPSRAALMTGKTNLRAGLEGNVPIPERAEKSGEYGLPTEQITMAEMLKPNGYYTALIGKWHLGHREQNLPNGQGFDYFFGHQRGCIDNYSHTFYWDGPNKHDLYRNMEEVYYDGEHFTDLMAEEVKQVINHRRNEPFFIYWAFNAPHYPYQGTTKWLDYYKNLPTPRKEYAAFVSNTDEKIGIVLDYLDEMGLAENTIVIFQSDHGHSLEERAFWGGGNAGPYRGSKFSLFEGGIRVPAIIRYPGVVPANEVRDQLSMEMDWFSTIGELTNSEVGDNIDGKSLMPIILDGKKESRHEVVHWQFGNYDDKTAQWAVRKGSWKLIGNVNEPSGQGAKKNLDKLFLVNLDKDIGEKNNLAKSNPKKKDELLQLHNSWIKSVRSEMKQ